MPNGHSCMRKAAMAGIVLAAIVVLSVYEFAGLGGVARGKSMSDAPSQTGGRKVPEATQSATQGTSTGGGQLLPAGHWELSWDDEFNSPADLGPWSFVVGNSGGKSMGQLAWDSPANATVQNGSLVMTADAGLNGQKCWYGTCKYTSANMNTHMHFMQTYGLFEARIRLPDEHGIWPTFWMEGDDYDKVGAAAGEVDIVEINGGEPPNQALGFAHAPKIFFRAICNIPTPLAADYHVYAVNWQPDGITWLVDNKACGHMDAYPNWPFNHPFYIILTLSVGGHWPGDPGSSTQFPAKTYVDWIRVYRNIS